MSTSQAPMGGKNLRGTGRNALGKGLGALIAPPKFANLRDDYFMCQLGHISPDPDQPRQRFDDAKLAELVASIKEKGVLQPLLVRRQGKGYVLIAGERRLRAAKQAGLDQVPVVVKDVANDEAFELALIENIQRDDLNAIEEAEAYQRLLDRPGNTQDVVARKVGKDRSTVANAVRLLRLPREVQSHIIEGQMTPGHARAVLSVQDCELRDRLVASIVDTQMSVRDAERKAKAFNDPKDAPSKRANKGIDLSADEQRLIERVAGELAAALDSAVLVRPGRAGKVTVTLGSLEQLERLRDLVVDPTG